MKFLIIVLVSILVITVLAKEKVIYEAKGSQLVDLLRGIPPEGGALKLSQVEGDKASLPDGVYFEPEDEALEDAGETGYLYLNGDKDDKNQNPIQKVHKPGRNKK